MFTNCRHCNALVATDPVTDEPPERCPHCAGRLRGHDAPAPAPAPAPVPVSTAPAATALADAADTKAQPAVPSVVPAPPGPPSVPDTVDAGGTAETAAATDATDATADTADAADTAPPASPAPAPANGGGPGDAAGPAIPAAPGKPAPSFVAPRSPRPSAPSRLRRAMPMAIAALGLLLVLQVLLANRARLAMDAGWRPIVAALCRVSGCSLPPWREPAALTLLSRDMRPDPGRPGVLRATATFRNDARWPQAWPTLVLTLSDADGRIAGVRAFAPEEYLGGPPAEETLASGQSAMIRLDVVEPAADVVAFSFDLR